MSVTSNYYINFKKSGLKLDSDDLELNQYLQRIENILYANTKNPNRVGIISPSDIETIKNVYV